MEKVANLFQYKDVSWKASKYIIMFKCDERERMKKYNHKKLQFITAAYTAQFVAMWLGTFGCWFGEPVTFGVSYEVLLC